MVVTKVRKKSYAAPLIERQEHLDDELCICFRQAKESHPDIKYIFLTGDFPAHDIWRQNR